MTKQIKPKRLPKSARIGIINPATGSMTSRDVVELFERVAVGTPVDIRG